MAGIRVEKELEYKVIEHITDNACSTLRIVINKECTLNCEWCYKEGIDHNCSKPRLTIKTLIRCIKLAKKSGFTKINFTGGEPLLYPNLFKIVKAADIIGLNTYVTTNATLFAGINLKDWTSLKNHEFHITLNTIDNKEFIRISKEDMLENVLRGIKALLAHDIPLKFNTVVTSEKDWPRIKKVLDFARRFKITVKLLGVHDSTFFKSMPQRNVAKMLLDKGARYVGTSTGKAANYGYEQYILNGTRVHVLNMVYGGGCCERYRLGLCGEGIRYPRLVYTGEIKPCLHKSIGIIKNDSTDKEIIDLLRASQNHIQRISSEPYLLDSNQWGNNSGDNHYDF